MTVPQVGSARDVEDESAAGGGSATVERARRRWPLFLGLAVAIVAVDQIAKAVVTSSLQPGQSASVIGDLVRVVFGQNSGALFGLFKDNAVMFGVVSLVVVGVIVAYHARAASSLYLTITLGLLLGGAVGNMLDRLRLGYVVDFVDVGLGTVRFYTFNVADSAISVAILLLFLAAIWPSLVEGAAVGDGPRDERRRSERRRRTGAALDGDEDPWDDEVDDSAAAEPSRAAGPSAAADRSAAMSGSLSASASPDPAPTRDAGPDPAR
jgi:signal peptidase II